MLFLMPLYMESNKVLKLSAIALSLKRCSPPIVHSLYTPSDRLSEINQVVFPVIKVEDLCMSVDRLS